MTEHAVDCAAIGALSEQHEKLKSFVGTFAAEVKLWMGPGEPMVSTGTMTSTLELGGRFLHQVFKGDPGGGPFPDFEGRGYWGYNTAARKFEGFWIDTASTVMQTETGDLDASGRIWTMIGETTYPTGKAMQKRSVITLKDDDHHVMEMYFKGPDGNEMKGMEIQYTRRN